MMMNRTLGIADNDAAARNAAIIKELAFNLETQLLMTFFTGLKIADPDW